MGSKTVTEAKQALDKAEAALRRAQEEYDQARLIDEIPVGKFVWIKAKLYSYSTCGDSTCHGSQWLAAVRMERGGFDILSATQHYRDQSIGSIEEWRPMEQPPKIKEGKNMVEFARFEQIRNLEAQGWVQDEECQDLQRADMRMGGPTFLKDSQGRIHEVSCGTERLLNGSRKRRTVGGHEENCLYTDGVLYGMEG
jgi:hypothetical protein